MSFREWLLTQQGRRNSIGDLARDVAGIPRLGDFSGADDLMGKVCELDWEASPAELLAMRDAESEWRAKGRDR